MAKSNQSVPEKGKRIIPFQIIVTGNMNPDTQKAEDITIQAPQGMPAQVVAFCLDQAVERLIPDNPQES